MRAEVVVDDLVVYRPLDMEVEVEEMVMDVKGLLIDIGMIIVMIIGVVEVTDVDHLHHDAVVEMMGDITEEDILVTEEVT